ncbi:hypothetical protein [Ciceribacter sp. L1K22]|uniref:hypothetical protein n=1 Tax=Ciceribacter sp. L1K22 TaxID=2820275 RepID=UPI001ABE5C03|nr:hypothetical protein [Ciceribacter sp. L1K22]MBO3760649.1 hypothetical protein [Ciceribacter sp. L1K22]
MKSILLGLSLTLLASSALAIDMTAPVKTLMQIAQKNWERDNTDFRDMFGDDLLDEIYSRDFANSYREASKFPVYDPPEGETTGTPLDYDPIVGGQDSCPIEKLKIEDDGDGQVVATFDNRNCFDEATNEPERVLIFHVIEEQGKAVIDDLYEVVDGQTGESLKGYLKEIGAQ